jgi:hypothetical protein
MIRHGTLSPFITNITNPGGERHSSPTRGKNFAPFLACLVYFQRSTGRCLPAKIKIGCQVAAGRPSRLGVLAAIADAGPIG